MLHPGVHQVLADLFLVVDRLEVLGACEDRVRRGVTVVDVLERPGPLVPPADVLSYAPVSHLVGPVEQGEYQVEATEQCWREVHLLGQRLIGVEPPVLGVRSAQDRTAALQ